MLPLPELVLQELLSFYYNSAVCVSPVSWYQGVEVSLKPYRLYPILAVSYVGAMVASNTALAYITYPTQVYICCLDLYIGYLL